MRSNYTTLRIDDVCGLLSPHMVAELGNAYTYVHSSLWSLIGRDVPVCLCRAVDVVWPLCVVVVLPRVQSRRCTGRRLVTRV